MNSRAIAAALLLSFAPAALGTAPAWAQSAPADDASTKAARARFQEGVAFYDKGQFENARAAFLQAYALRKHPAVLLNLAQSSLRSGHTLEAAGFFKQYLHESTGLTSAQKLDAEKGLADARLQLGRVEVSAASGTEISIDGERVGTTPLAEPIDVEAGSHKVSGRLPDGTTDTKSATAVAGQAVTVHFGAAAPPPPPPPTPEPTPEPKEPPEEKPPSEPPPPQPPPEEKPKSRGGPKTVVPTIVGAVVSVAGFVTAIVMASSKAKAQSNANDVASAIQNAGGGKSTCYQTPTSSTFYVPCKTLASDDSNVNADATIANVGLVVGIVGAVGALGWYLLGPRDSAPSAPPPTTALTPMIGPHGGGLGFTATF
jgi:outer membrane biosynthesis protein TonB